MKVNLYNLEKKPFGPYDMIKYLGEGGMGIVYLAKERDLDRLVALKLLKSDHLQNESLVKRFNIEARAAARLNHPNIVTIFAVGSVNGIPYISMEYIEGKTLQKVIGSEKISIETTLRIVRQIAEALNCAHTNNIIHRDIKPANIIINKDGIVKVADFGLAKLVGDKNPLTKKGAIIGTPSYMSPEQCVGEEVTYKTDLYSLGVIFYEMISGKLPYRTQNPVALINSITLLHPEDIQNYVPTISKDLASLIMTLLRKQPNKRMSSAKEIVYTIDLINKTPINLGTITKSVGEIDEMKPTVILPKEEPITLKQNLKATYLVDYLKNEKKVVFIFMLLGILIYAIIMSIIF